MAVLIVFAALAWLILLLVALANSHRRWWERCEFTPLSAANFAFWGWLFTAAAIIGGHYSI